jgi:hypothetical protein
LNRLWDEPFNPKINPSGPDYTVQYYTNRTLKLIEALANDPTFNRQVKANPESKKQFMSSLFILILGDKLHTLSTLTLDSNRDLIQRMGLEIQCVYAPLAERFGQFDMAAALRNEVFRTGIPNLFPTNSQELSEYLPRWLRNMLLSLGFLSHPTTRMDTTQEYREFRQIYRQKLGLSHTQSKALLNQFFNRLKAIPGMEGLITILTREKTYESAFQKWTSRNAYSEEDPWWLDFLGILTVFETPADLARYRSTLVRSLGTPENPTVNGEEIDVVRLKGRVAYQSVKFSFLNPYRKDGSSVFGELQAMTRQYYNYFLSGRSPAKYEEAHWKKTAQRTINNIFRKLYPGTHSRQQFDHTDPLLTGDLGDDLTAACDDLKDSVFPLHASMSQPRDEESMQIPDNLQWQITKLQKVGDKDPKLADLAFHADAGYSPTHYSDFRRLLIERSPKSAHETNRYVQKSPPETLRLIYKLQATDVILFFDDPSRPRGISKAHEEELPNRVTSPRASVLLLKDLGKPNDIQDWILRGRQDLAKRFGDITDPDFVEHVLQPVQHWMGLKTSEEFYLAWGYSKTNKECTKAPALVVFQERFNEWYSHRFVVPKVSAAPLPGGLLKITIRAEENPLNFMQTIMGIVAKRKLPLTSQLAMTTAVTGTVEIVLTIQPPKGFGHKDAAALANELRYARHPRQARLEHQDAERYTISMTLTKKEELVEKPGLILKLVQDLNARGIQVETITLNPHNSDLQWVVLAPPEQAKNQTPEQVLKTELNKLETGEVLLKYRVDKTGLNDTTETELRAFFASEAEQIPEAHRSELAFNPKKVIKELPSRTQGYLDETFMKNVRNFYGIVTDFFGHPDPNHPSNNDWAQPETRREGGAPYLIHLLSTTWNMMTIGGVKDLDLILVALGHDLFENGPNNAWMMVETLVKDLSDVTRMIGGHSLPIEERLAHVRNHYPSIAGDIENYFRKPSKGLQPFLHTLKKKMIPLARAAIESRIRESLPRSVSEQLLESIHRLTRDRNRSYGAHIQELYMHKLLLMMIKFFDRAHNVQDRLPNQINKTIRYFLKPLSQPLEDPQEIPGYEEGRQHLLAILVEQVIGMKPDNLGAFYEDQGEIAKRAVHSETILQIENFIHQMELHPSAWGTIAKGDQVLFIEKLLLLKNKLDLRSSSRGTPKRLQQAG